VNICDQVRSSHPGKFVFTSWEFVIMMSGVFKSICFEQDGHVHFLQ